MNLIQLKRIRWVVRATLALGVIASTIANILHAQDNPISQTIAAWPPVALLLTIELISRVPVHRRSLTAVRLVATALIASIAAWVSYWHMVGVIARYGETGAGPYLIPFTVDGLVVVASVCLVELGGRIRSANQPHTTTGAAAAARSRPTHATTTSTDAKPAAQPTVPGAAHPARPSRRPAKPRRPALVIASTDPTADDAGNGSKEVKVPQTAEACTRWVACWIAMCRDGLDTGPISLSFETEAKNRYGWGVKQIRDVRNAATSGQLRRQAEHLGVELPPEYADERGDSSSSTDAVRKDPVAVA